MSVYALLLAAGAGSRFGVAPKLLADLNGQPLAGYALAALESALPGRVLTVLGAAYDQLLAGLQPRWSVFCADWQVGLSESLRAGVTALPDDASAVLVALADQPRLSAGNYRQLLADFEQHGLPVCACAEDYLGVPAVFVRADFAALGGLSGDRGARGLLQQWQRAGRLRTCYLPAALQDVDTPAQLRNLSDGERALTL